MGKHQPSDRAAQFEQITRDLSSMQDERERRAALTPCCARCKTPFGHSAIAGVCCHTKGTR